MRGPPKPGNPGQSGGRAASRRDEAKAAAARAETACLWLMVGGVLAIGQPWLFWMFPVGFLLILAGFVGYQVFSRLAEDDG